MREPGPTRPESEMLERRRLVVHVLITALHSFHNRTGADMTQWFGQHQVATKVRRQARLALAA